LSKRLVAVVVLGVLLSAPASAFVVIDSGVLFQQVALTKLQEQILDMVTEQGHLIRRMGRRLTVFVDMARYAPQGMPLWRTRQGLSEVPGVEAYMNTLNLGGDATEGVTVPMGEAERALLRLDIERADALRVKLANAELDQSVFAVGSSATGRERGRRKKEKTDLEELERDVLDGRLGTSARLDVLASAQVIERRQVATQIKLQIALLEQLIAQTKAHRDREAEAANQWLNRPQKNEGDAGLAYRATQDLKTWRLP
jgi:hypothetical protein